MMGRQGTGAGKELEFALPILYKRPFPSTAPRCAGSERDRKRPKETERDQEHDHGGPEA